MKIGISSLLAPFGEDKYKKLCEVSCYTPVMPNGIEERSDTGLALGTYNTNVSFMRELALYARDIGVVVRLDTAHAVIFREWQPHIALKKYKDIIKALHIHDNRGQSDDHFFPFARGCVTDRQVFSEALREIVFDGVFNFECEPSSRQPVPRLLRRSQGARNSCKMHNQFGIRKQLDKAS